MATIEINEKEYELKLTYESIKYLNKQFEGGSYELIGLAIQGDIEAFPKIVHAGLFHADEKFTLKKVEGRIEELINTGEMSLEDISTISDEVVTQSFFYKATVEKLMRNSPEMRQALEQLRG